MSTIELNVRNFRHRRNYPPLPAEIDEAHTIDRDFDAAVRQHQREQAAKRRLVFGFNPSARLTTAQKHRIAHSCNGKCEDF